jgi:Divergent InlB B-repeat domain
MSSRQTVLQAKRYLSPGSQSFDVSCGPSYTAVTLTFQTQYSLTVTSKGGGVGSPAGPWQNAGAAVTLTATPNVGYWFAGWEGDCMGQGSCQLVMNGPKAVKADLVATGAHQRPF